MQCARCGDILAPFDQRCPKCEHLARTGQLVPQPGPIQAGRPPPPWANSTKAPSNRTAIVLFGSIFLVLILIATTIYALAPRSGNKGAGGLMLVQSSGGRGGFNLTNT